MSKLNTNSLVYCGCSPKRVDFNDVIGDSRRYHDINSILFCPACQSVKCKFCTKSDIHTKYCCSCMSDYSSTNEVHCTRNCFICPKCDSPLAISLSDHKIDGTVGKQFSFSCTFCDFSYETKIITKPKSILNIIRGEYAENNDLEEYFNLISTMHKHKLNFETLAEQMLKDLKRGIKYKGISIDAIRHIKDMKISIPQDENPETLDSVKLKLDENKPVVLDDREVLTIERSFPCTEGFMMFNAFNSNLQDSKPLLPVPKRLTTKSIKTCCDCNHILSMPSEEVLSTKYNIKWNANDYLPLISISPLLDQSIPTTIESGKSYTFLINIINPLAAPIMINLSSPSTYNQKKSKVQTTIPVSTITVGEYNPKDHVIRGIPTSYLTKETKISRAERVMRIGRSSSLRSNDTSIEFIETLVEKNDNWCSLPIEVVVESEQELDTISIPIFVNVQSKLPDNIKQLKLLKRDLSYGFWSILSLEEVYISH